MTLGQIMTLALRQLDEDPEDIGEYDDLFRAYVNEGYRIAVAEYLKPRKLLNIETDDKGYAGLGCSVSRVVELKDKNGENVWFDLLPNGKAVRAHRAKEKLVALCEVYKEPLENTTDTPQLPESAHAALADYVCMRHLGNGNAAKQARAGFYETKFYQAMRRINREGYGDVTRPANLYAVTDVRYRGW